MAEHGRIQNDEIKKKKSIRLHFEEVERKTGAEGLSFVDDVAWVATGKDVEEVTAKLEACAAAAGGTVRAPCVVPVITGDATDGTLRATGTGTTVDGAGSSAA